MISSRRNSSACPPLIATLPKRLASLTRVATARLKTTVLMSYNQTLCLKSTWEFPFWDICLFIISEATSEETNALY